MQFKMTDFEGIGKPVFFTEDNPPECLYLDGRALFFREKMLDMDVGDSFETDWKEITRVA